MTNFTYDENIFSDMHKDAYGFRPRGHEFYTATPERKQEIWDRVAQDVHDEIERERLAQLDNQRRFEEHVTRTIEAGAADRETAIRWIMQAEGIDAHDAAYGGSYACYHFGVCYELAPMFEPFMKEIVEREGNPYQEAA